MEHKLRKATSEIKADRITEAYKWKGQTVYKREVITDGEDVIVILKTETDEVTISNLTDFVMVTTGNSVHNLPYENLIGIILGIQ